MHVGETFLYYEFDKVSAIAIVNNHILATNYYKGLKVEIEFQELNFVFMSYKFLL